MHYLTTRDAGIELGVTTRRVNALIRGGRLRAEKIGSIWAIDPADLDAVRVRKTGKRKKIKI